MKINVSGKGYSVGESLTTHIQDTLKDRIKKYFENAVAADIVLSKESHYIKADIVVNDGTGTHPMLKASAKTADPYVAFDDAADKIEKQLRRYKRRIKNHHKNSHISRDEMLSDVATKYVISEAIEDGSVAEESSPLIIAEKSEAIAKLTVADAVMQMNLKDLPCLLFINKKTDSLSVVYHRKDGNISWIDTKFA
jgi:ribosomal subunit interface protein